MTNACTQHGLIDISAILLAPDEAHEAEPVAVHATGAPSYSVCISLDRLPAVANNLPVHCFRAQDSQQKQNPGKLGSHSSAAALD